jgi:hypothetical protein
VKDGVEGMFCPRNFQQDSLTLGCKQAFVHIPRKAYFDDMVATAMHE